jgi:hypothetical protein
MPDLNVGLFASGAGKPTTLRFVTGDCADGTVTHPDSPDPVSRSTLASLGVDTAADATLGQCSP